MRGNVFRDADHGADTGVDCFVDRIGSETRRHEDQRRVRVRMLDRLDDGVEDGNSLDVLAAFARRHSRNDVRAVVAVAQPVEASFASRQALNDEPSVVVDDDRHQR